MTTHADPTTGLVAILRGIEPPEVIDIGHVLADAGFSTIEVPLNSPDPFRSIELLADELADRCAIGAGTVLHADEVIRAHDAGSTIIVSPNTDPDVIATAVARGLRPYPGVATVTEAFGAIKAGARSLKLFPSDSVGIAGMRAWTSVLPPGVELLPVGGVDVSNLGAWGRAGAGGAGLGSSLYRPGDSVAQVRSRARAFIDIWSAATSPVEERNS